MKIDFISHVSHELRTPLTVIKEATGMLLDGTYADSRESQQELLTRHSRSVIGSSARSIVFWIFPGWKRK